jgi:asparagine synthase (glutamine-hydrolysing)
MCGITGYIDFTKRTKPEVIHDMVGTMLHRGPDDFGAENYENPFAIIGLGQARLSIIDLSDAGHQPMQYQHLSIVFNGEIYNYKEIKSDLENIGHSFSSSSDTEVILHAYLEWGVQAVHRFIGMFAFCIYDSIKSEIILIRDRAGVKPLYYYFKDGLFLFGSELKPLMQHPAFEKLIEPRVLPLYLQYGYIPSPYAIFKDCKKLNAGNLLHIELKDGSTNLTNYWSVATYYSKPKLLISYEEAKIELHKLLKSALRYRLVSDVPVGIFLSGGYDSTAVAAILQKLQKEKLKTFTIGFEEGNNEAPFAKNTAKYIGTDHHEFICTTKEAQGIIPDIPYYYDEPFGDSSAIPTILVSKIAKMHVSVALSADAGDEVFCGYNSYSDLKTNLSYLNLFPPICKPFIKQSGVILTNILPLNYVIRHKAISFFRALDENELEQSKHLFRLRNEKSDSYLEKFFIQKIDGFSSPYNIQTDGFHNGIEVAMAIDYNVYLQNDILTKVDRATMSVSLEGREPLLDHRLVEFVAQLPLEYKFNGITQKRIFKDIVHDYIPKEMMDRPKVGFSLPIYDWLRGDLSNLVDEYLSKDSLKWSGLFNDEFIMMEVSKFKRKKLHYSPIIWYLLMFQMWYKRWMIQ